MTEKQEKILTTALQLFADKGYDATSTSKVAKAAGVSEGLIFRHFGNKEGLLNAIKQYGMEKAALVMGPILEEEDPKKIIKAALEMPFAFQKIKTLFGNSYMRLNGKKIFTITVCPILCVINWKARLLN